MFKQLGLVTSMQLAFSKFLGITAIPFVKPKQMWNAHVSYTTYQSLKRQGVLA
jgi:hypothetical protein